MSWAPSTSQINFETIVKNEEDADSYDELMDEGDDEESLPPPPTPGSAVPTLISGALRPYRTLQLPATSINIMVNTGDIDLEVEYQRDVVWTEARQEGLIDSMFCNFFIPPVLFACRMNEDGTQKRICMDGKQRLTSIAKFMSGQIPWRPKSGPGKGKKYWYAFDPQRHKGLELPKRERGIFDGKQIQIAEFDDLTEETEREIFQRVQLGVALSPAEKLQALATPHTTWISSLLNKYVFANGYGSIEGINLHYNDWKQDRGQAFQNVCVMVYMIEKIPAQTTSVGATTLHKWLQREDPVEMFMRRRIDAIFTHYVELVARYKDVAITACGKRLSPIEFSFIGIVLHILGPYISIVEVAERIGDMRVYIRRVDANVRSNTNTIKALWAWLELQPKKRITHPSLPPLMEFDATEGSGRKRRRQDEELNGGDDGDYVGGGIRGGSPSTYRTTRARV